MLIYIIKKNKLETFTLPQKVIGSYWLKDTKSNGKERELINIKEVNGQWIAKSNRKAYIAINGKKYDSVYLKEYQFIILELPNTEEMILLYMSPVLEKNMIKLKYNDIESFSVGSNLGNSIVFQNPLVGSNHIKIVFEKNYLTIEDFNTKYGTFVNNEPIIGKRQLFYGDIIFVMGLKIIVLNKFIYINNPLNAVKFDNNIFNREEKIINNGIDDTIEYSDVDDEISLYEEQDYFIKSPRFTEIIDNLDFNIEAPPKLPDEDNTPLLLTLGPSLTMGMTSFIYIYMSINQLQQGSSLVSTLPMIVMSVSMLAGTLLWPVLSRRYAKKQRKIKEEKIKTKYSEYLLSKEKELRSIITMQRNVLLSNYLSTDECYQLIVKRNRYLWTREINQTNFLTIRLGLGDVPLKLKINAPSEHFSIDDDILENKMHDIVNNNKKVVKAPVILSLIEKNIVSIVGEYSITKKYMDNLLVQLLALHSYYDLKIVILTNQRNDKYWRYLKIAPHIWTNEKELRYYGTNDEENQELSLVLSKIIDKRLEYFNKNKRNDTYKNFESYYIIITDDYKNTRDLEILKSLEDNSGSNLGMSLIILNENLANLPSECKSFIILDNDNEGSLLESELSSENQIKFSVEIANKLNLKYYPVKLANIPMVNEDENYSFPKLLGFLEMYRAGTIEQLNPIERWEKSNPIQSLSVPVGIDTTGNLFKLDLHEKAHGPHGLIAGMTGSGKSEFIITYILSMAINYSPEEVQFVLIDYKGGGLVGAFKNSDTGVKLPHLAGTITNLDVSEINRSLASIESELKRRQELFNEARDKLGEGTIDIYKYQKYYRDGVLEKSIPHLFIISDEFAELKDQQPEFMDQLISTARIGRSLGVHLILATQKPSGVVNAQIWSNSRFRICLKVQDESDSNEMLRKPDAASIKETGRFYLQVGYDELYQLGQAAYAGSKYIPKDKVRKVIDEKVVFIDNIGREYNSIELPKKETIKELGEELPNIVKYLNDIAVKENIITRQLWLDKIPDVIYVDKLKQKYDYKYEQFNIKPIIGEYDNPKKQEQGLLTLNLSEQGNAAIYSSDSKTEITNSIIYSLITTYPTQELNLYLLDLDTETQKIFEEAPQVGDVIFSTETEKIKNLFKMLDREIVKRKKLFQNYNGSYKYYCENSGETLPSIVLMISGYENFKESFEDEEEVFSKLSRDCTKYGIYFIITAINERAMRLNTRSNFPIIIPLKIIGGTVEYNMLLGKKCPVIPDIPGRGVALIDDEPYEFQSASICEKSKTNKYITSVCQKIKEKVTEKAPSVPILPEKVLLPMVLKYLDGLKKVPIGVEAENIFVESIDFTKKLIYMINSEDTEQLKNYSYTLIDEISYINGIIPVVIDNEQMFEGLEFKKNILKLTDNILPQLKQVIEQPKEKIIFINGVSDFIQNLDLDIKNNLDTYLSQIQKTKNCRFVFITTLEDIKMLSYEPWFKKYVSLDNGIWLGKGISDSTIHRLQTPYRTLNQPIANGFGYHIFDGNAIKIKLIEKGGDING